MIEKKRKETDNKSQHREREREREREGEEKTREAAQSEHLPMAGKNDTHSDGRVNLGERGERFDF